jgi:Tfp pilus assembly protein FimV
MPACHLFHQHRTITSRVVSLRLYDDILSLPQPPHPVPNLQPLRFPITHKCNVIGELTTRLTTLASQLESALSLSPILQAQHAAAQSTISALENKVDALEEMVKTTQQAQAVTVPTASSSSDARATAGARESSGTRRQRIPYADLERLEEGYGRAE